MGGAPALWRLFLRRLGAPALAPLQRGHLLRIDPPSVQIDTVDRIDLGPRELVPVRDALLADVPVRHHVVAPEHYAIERPGRGDEIFARRRGDDLLDQMVHHRILDAREIAAARDVRGLAAPEVALLVAGRQTLAPGGDDHVEVELVEAVLVLSGVDRAHL